MAGHRQGALEGGGVTRKRHQQEHRPQRPTESSDPTQHAKGRTGDRPGPRKGTTTRRNVTRGVTSPPSNASPPPPPPPVAAMGRGLLRWSDQVRRGGSLPLTICRSTASGDMGCGWYPPLVLVGTLWAIRGPFEAEVLSDEGVSGPRGAMTCSSTPCPPPHLPLFRGVTLLRRRRTQRATVACLRVNRFPKPPMDGSVSRRVQRMFGGDGPGPVPIALQRGRTVRCAKSWPFSTTGSSVSSED